MTAPLRPYGADKALFDARISHPSYDELRDFERNAHGAQITRKQVSWIGRSVIAGAAVALAILAVGKIDTDRPEVCAGLVAAECGAAVVELR